MAGILNPAILHLAILDSVILVFPLKFTHTCQDWVPPFAQQNFIHTFWLNLMMAAILNSAMLDSDTAILESDTLLSSLRFTQKPSPSTLTLTQTNAIWLTRWWQPSWNWPSRIQLFCIKLWLNLIQSDSSSFILTQLDDGSHLEFCHVGFTLPSWIQTPCYLLSDSLKNTLTPLWLWLKLIQSDSNSFILT